MYCVCLRNNGTTWNATCSVTVTVVSIVRSLIEVLFEIHYKCSVFLLYYVGQGT